MNMNRRNATKVTSIVLVVTICLLLTGSVLFKTAEKEAKTVVKQNEKVNTIKTSQVKIEEEEKIAEVIPVSITDAEDYLRSISKGTNLDYVGEVTEYYYKENVLKRFEDFVYFDDESLSGYDFILADDGKIWFIDDKRMISSYDYQSRERIVYESADLYTEPQNKVWYDKHQVIDGNVTAITAHDFQYTVLIDGNEIATYGRKNEYGTACISSIYFPFEIAELTSTYYTKYSDEDWRLNFISNTGVIGQLIFTADGVSYKIIDASNSEKSLYYVEGNRVDTRGNWVVYYKDGELVAGDGELTFSFDEMDYREMWLGDTCGLGKGYENFAAVLIPVDDYEAFDTMSIEELLDIYVM